MSSSSSDDDAISEMLNDGEYIEDPPQEDAIDNLAKGTNDGSVTSPKGKFRLHMIGTKPMGPREYHLLPLNIKLPKDKEMDEMSPKGREIIQEYKVASLFCHQATLLGASCSPNYPLLKTCGPLVKRALNEMEGGGDQIQALAALDGLCDWTAECIDKQGEGSEALSKLMAKVNDDNDEEALKLLEAVQAIATGIPRPGHSVVGQGTYRDGEPAWIALAKEFGHKGLSPEVELYQNHGAQVVEVLHLADTSPAYLQKAGGAMLHMFFLA
jgi:hypothetical protein